MFLLLALSMASTAFLLSGAAASVTFLKLFRRWAPPSLCGCRSLRGIDAAAARVSDGPDSLTGSSAAAGCGKQIDPTTTVRRFRWPEIESLTDRFTTPVIGEGGFSTVHLGRLRDSSPAAVKLHRSGSSERLLRAFRQELAVLLLLRHPHIVRLLGFCDEWEEGGVLVFEYVPGGTLHRRLRGAAALPWDRRMRIALRVAEAVEYLHEGGDLPVVHGDISAANVLLDDRCGPVLCDFGSARVGFSEAVQPAGAPVIGSPGYADPHYLRTGILSKKSDVYSFGVLLLELVTGLPAVPLEGGMPLAAAARLAAGWAIGVDPRLGAGYDAGEAATAIEMAVVCVGDQPGLRPAMAEVVRVMTEKMPSSISTVHTEPHGRTEYLTLCSQRLPSHVT
ncbi:putative receptor-like protein kinase [Apostasia shenzhenica]|uniref:Putative receptor-like protein kinase n=1 Tax=Apostasia shenzhenica TaxID=1088818 RepID=A0A2I0A3T4_9ASPA|nr:putative receptor-like protein kinase [Apostasia shenzhenica]